MRKYINGKVYDTDNSTYITECGDFNVNKKLMEQVEELHKTSKGEYFIYSYTNHLFKIDDKVDEDIKVKNIMQVMKWFEKNQSNFGKEETFKFLQEFRRFYYKFFLIFQ